MNCRPYQHVELGSKIGDGRMEAVLRLYMIVLTSTHYACMHAATGSTISLSVFFWASFTHKLFARELDSDAACETVSVVDDDASGPNSEGVDDGLTLATNRFWGIWAICFNKENMLKLSPEGP